jgi:hypothetical protein
MLWEEWDNERSSQSDVDNPNVHPRSVSISDVILSLDAVATPPKKSTEDKEEIVELDITDTGSNRSIMAAASHESIAESQLQNNTPEASNTEMAPTAAQRTSTIDLDSMEQGSFTSALRRRTMPRAQVQV